MENETNKFQHQKNCSICKRSLKFWNTQLKKYHGSKICTSCAWKVAKKEISGVVENQRESETNQKVEDFGDRVGNLGKKLTMGLTVPIILFFVGFLTLPIGILFWLLGIGFFVKLFSNKPKTK